MGDVLAGKLASLEAFVPPSDGDVFFALGVRFSTFNLLDSFVLVAVSIGSTVRIDALGLSTLVVPRPEAGASVTPLAEVQIALHAQIVPAEGFVGVEARLTPASYVLSRQCHLSGGAALYSWFSGPHAGDFVVTVGGYHPAFVRPPHYPEVPRLAFEWQVTAEVALKGSLYFALAAHALMAGGSLEATYTSGALSAWFRAGIDFLVAWKPYHYDAHAFINVGARWHSIEAELGVDLHVWGPDFAGSAEVDLVVTSFTIEFGASRAPAPQPLDWTTFAAASLPPSAAVCTIACQRGLVRQLDPGPGLAGDWVVGAHDLVVAVASQIPSTGYQVNDGDAQRPPGTAALLGVAPMAVAPGELDAQLHVTFSRVDGTARTPVAMQVTPVLKSVPAALWGTAQAPKVNGDRMIVGALSELELRPPPRTATCGRNHRQTQCDGLGRRRRARLGTDGLLADSHRRPTSAPRSRAQRRSARMNRTRLLQGLGLDPGGYQPGPDPEESFLVPPRIVRFERTSA